MAAYKRLTENDEIAGITGTLHTSDDTSHEFTKDNACPYFRKSGFCTLSGFVCNYDTATYPLCKTYAKGVAQMIPGPDGQVPTVPPVSSYAELKGNQAPQKDTTEKPLFRS